MTPVLSCEVIEFIKNGGGEQEAKVSETQVLQLALKSSATDTQKIRRVSAISSGQRERGPYGVGLQRMQVEIDRSRKGVFGGEFRHGKVNTLKLYELREVAGFNDRIVAHDNAMLDSGS